jgi:hypothetical protein
MEMNSMDAFFKPMLLALIVFVGIVSVFVGMLAIIAG